jgi:hypothetical protein
MLTFRHYLLLASVYFLSACTNPSGDLLDGRWVAVEILEAGDSLAVDPSLVSFSFDEERGKYSFSSTLNYREAGAFYLEKGFLYTTDTLNRASRKKVVEVLTLNNDSLILRMQEINDQERILKLIPVD